MSFRSIVVETDQQVAGHSTDSPEFNFLRFLHRDLASFGRSDVSLVVVADKAYFSWSTAYNKPASVHLRHAIGKSRISRNREKLMAFERERPDFFNLKFDVDSETIDPVVKACSEDKELEKIFDYYAILQSLKAVVKRGRYGKFCVFDSASKEKPLMAIIGLSSPVYFNGGRDSFIGWSPIGTFKEGFWHEDAPSKRRRDLGLLNLTHLSLATPVPPYDDLKISKLVSLLCFSDDVVGWMERKYSSPIVAITTTGGWGSNAAPYQRIRLDQLSDGNSQKLFHRVEPKSPSLNMTLDYFSDDTIEAALRLHKLRSPQQSSEFEKWRDDCQKRTQLLKWSLQKLKIPRVAVYVNEISHFFGAVTNEAQSFLANVDSQPVPKHRSIKVSDAVNCWRKKAVKKRLVGVSPTKLSTL